MLRIVLLFFGWTIPVLALLSAGTMIYFGFNLPQSIETATQEPSLVIIRAVAGLFDNLAISALCFFGAHMLNPEVAP